MLMHSVPSHSLIVNKVYFPDTWLWDGLIRASGMLVDVIPAEALHVCAYLGKPFCTLQSLWEKYSRGAYRFPKKKKHVEQNWPKPWPGSKHSRDSIGSDKLQLTCRYARGKQVRWQALTWQQLTKTATKNRLPPFTPKCSSNRWRSLLFPENIIILFSYIPVLITISFVACVPNLPECNFSLFHPELSTQYSRCNLLLVEPIRIIIAPQLKIILYYHAYNCFK